MNKLNTTNNHISYLKIENFKCFNKFELKNIGQFNLILGDNNVGKTTVLEALLFDDDLYQYLYYLIVLLNQHNFGTFEDILSINYLDLFFNKFNNSKDLKISFKYFNEKKLNNYKLSLLKKSNLTKSELSKLKERPYDDLIKFTKNKKSEINFLKIINPIESKNKYYPFVSTNKKYDEDLITYYSENIQFSKTLKTDLINDLRYFINNLEDIELSKGLITNKDILITRIKDFDTAFPMPMYGEGALVLLRILLEISFFKNNRLMIDEIDTGIHYSRFKSFWKSILKSALKHNVQLFITTHNFECLNYLKEVLLDKEMEGYKNLCRSFTLNRLPDNSIKAYSYTFDEFDFAINQGIEIRGGE